MSMRRKKSILVGAIEIIRASSNYHKSQNIIQLSVLTLVVVLFASTAFATPDVFNVTQKANELKITGLAFGTKATPAPVYWNNLESETTGVNIPGWTVSSKPGAVVSSTDKWSGNKSLYFAMKSSNPTPGWNQILRDMGTASNQWYFHFKVRLNKNDSNTRFQWKAWRISSSSDGYAWNTEPTTTVFMNDLFWYDENHAGSKGWNGPSGATFNNGGTSGNSTSVYFKRSDAIIFNQWQTLEQFIKQSSGGSTSDGIDRMWRDGILVQENTSLVTGTSSSGVWRYMLLGQNINNTLPVAGQMDMDVYFDDIYIDNTQARVMMCDSPTWAARTHCEIQLPIKWSSDSITFTVNTGSFSSGTAYLFVVDENGATTDGYPVNIQ